MSFSVRQTIKNLWKKEKLMLFIIIGVALGFLIGILGNRRVQQIEEPNRTNLIIGFELIGTLFLQCLRLVILPLILSSLIRGVATLDYKSGGIVSIGTLVYYISTTVIAVVLGIILVIAIGPGNGLSKDQFTIAKIEENRPIDMFLDIIRNMLPDNLIQATFQLAKTPSRWVHKTVNTKNVTIASNFASMTEQEKKEYILQHNITQIVEDEHKTLVGMVGYKKSYQLPGSRVFSNGMNMSGIIVFGIIFGALLSSIGEKAHTLLLVLEAIDIAMTKFIKCLMWVSPIAIPSLIIGQFWKISSLTEIFKSISLYFMTVLAGLAIHLFIILSVIYFVFTRKNPYRFLSNMSRSIVTGFATASSSATISVTLQCLEEKNKISPLVTRFMVPIGATINMDGTALYEAVAAIFIAQVYNIPMDGVKILVVSLTATLGSIGAAGIPQGGLVTLVVVLQMIGLPAESLALILSVDWLLDRFRTVVNILGDSFGCAVVYQFLKKRCAKFNQAVVTESKAYKISNGSNSNL